MATLYICNTFSLSMLDRDSQLSAPRIPKPIDNPEYFLGATYKRTKVVSAVGHADTASIFAEILDVDSFPEFFPNGLKPNRINVSLTNPKDHALVGQYIGPRLPEGATTLPEGARIDWWLI